jgi:hypothetical protein
VFRVTPPYKEWLLRNAKFRRSDVSTMIDQDVAAAAKANGFEEPPPR